MKKLLLVIGILALVLAWRDWNRREIVHPPGVLVPERPVQTSVDGGEPITAGEFRLQPRATFELRARVLSREDYWLGTEAELSPLDLALGWGAMSDQAILDRIEITQGSRWYFTRYESPAPLSDRGIVTQSSNMHMVPSNHWVRGKLKEVRRGDVVLLKGYLVDIRNEAGFFWPTSLSREDTGNGACELFYVEYIFIEDRPG